MERRGFIGTIMGAVSAVLVPIPVGKNMLADYAEPVKIAPPIDWPIGPIGKYGSGTMPTYTGVLTACSGIVMSPEIERDIALNTWAKDHVDEVTRFELGDI